MTVKDARKNALSEIPLITGVTCLTIPCEPAKKSDYDIRPIYLGHGYACVFCGGYFFRYRPCLTHMGMDGTKPCSCDRANDWHKKMAFDHKLRCAFCNSKFSSFEALGVHVNVQHPDIELQLKQELAVHSEQQEKEMGKSIADMKQERGIGGPPMLRGQDVPRSVNCA